MDGLSEELIAEWLEEFRIQHPESGGAVRVVRQDTDDGQFDYGLVIGGLHRAPTTVYLERPVASDSPWQISFAPRPEVVQMDYFQAEELAREIITLARLAEFLGRKTGEAFVRDASDQAPSGEIPIV